MAKRISERGDVVAVQMSATELAQLFRVDVERLREWEDLIPSKTTAEGERYYEFSSPEDLKLARVRAKVLATGMRVDAVRAIEREGLLGGYAALSEDAPEGITAQCWRSYAVVVLMQVRHNKMINAEELAEHARLMEQDPFTGKLRPSADIAQTHLNLLQAMGYLQHGGRRWEHKGLPRCMRGKD